MNASCQASQPKRTTSSIESLTANEISPVGEMRIKFADLVNSNEAVRKLAVLMESRLESVLGPDFPSVINSKEDASSQNFCSVAAGMYDQSNYALQTARILEHIIDRLQC